MRTTSSLEAFNSYLNRTMAKRAGFFKFVSNLKLHESRKAETMHHLANDTVPDSQYNRRKLSDQKRDKKIKILTEQLSNGMISMTGFLDAMVDDEDELIESEYEWEEDSEEDEMSVDEE